MADKVALACSSQIVRAAVSGCVAGAACLAASAYADVIIDPRVACFSDKSIRCGVSAVAFFATEPGKGSPFALEFADQIDRRQSLDEVFRKTAIAVTKRTDNRQSPWRRGDLAFDVFVSGMRALPIP